MLVDVLRGCGFQASACCNTNAGSVILAARELAPCTTVLNFDFDAGRSGAALIAALHEVGARVVVLSKSTNRIRLAECVEAGADAVVTKAHNVVDLVHVVHETARAGCGPAPQDHADLLAELQQHRATGSARGGPFPTLTNRERQVLSALVGGKNAQAIADETFTSVRTVRGHIQMVLRKLGVNSQLAAVARAKEAGWSGDLTDAPAMAGNPHD